jgi:hypothetical protein
MELNPSRTPVIGILTTPVAEKVDTTVEYMPD